MKPEEKPQEPLKTPCRFCKGDGWVWIALPTCSSRKIGCHVCKGSRYEKKP